MATRKAAPKASAKGAAARSETNGAAKTVKFRKLSLTLKQKLPATIIFDLEEFDGNQVPLTALMRLLRSILGPEQLEQLRGELEGDTVDDLGDIFGELLSVILAKYGIELGESSASPKS